MLSATPFGDGGEAFAGGLLRLREPSGSHLMQNHSSVFGGALMSRQRRWNLRTGNQSKR